MLLCVDPGVRGCGAALFEGPNLLNCWYWRGEKGPALASAKTMASTAYEGREQVSAVIVELPQSYTAGRQKGDQNDLISLALVAGYVLGAHSHAAGSVVRPREWKGTLDPDKMLARIEERLTATERATLSRCSVPLSLKHNVVDAIGIGLWAVGRLEPRRVFSKGTP